MQVHFSVLEHWESKIYIIDRTFACVTFTALSLDPRHSFMGRGF